MANKALQADRQRFALPSAELGRWATHELLF